jgi:hypothetical protein
MRPFGDDSPNLTIIPVTSWREVILQFIQFFLGWCPHQNLEKVDFCGVSLGFLMDFHGFSPEFRVDFPIRGPGSKTSSAWWGTGHNSFPMNWRSHTPGLAGAYVVGLSNDIYVYICIYFFKCIFICIYICIYAYICIYIYVYIYVCAYIYIQYIIQLKTLWWSYAIYACIQIHAFLRY